jgi:hypothetical protein
MTPADRPLRKGTAADSAGRRVGSSQQKKKRLPGAQAIDAMAPPCIVVVGRAAIAIGYDRIRLD